MEARSTFFRTPYFRVCIDGSESYGSLWPLLLNLNIKRGMTSIVVSGSIDGLFLRRFHSLLQNSEVLLHRRSTHWHQLRPKHEGRLKSRTQLTPIPSQTFYYSETTQIAYKNAKMPLGAIIFPISIGKINISYISLGSTIYYLEFKWVISWLLFFGWK